MASQPEVSPAPDSGTTRVSLGPDYFDRLYAADPDPWGFASRWYEERKYALTIASLPRRRYRRAFEPGCSIGVLSGLLAKRCEELLAMDIAQEALQTIATRNLPAHVIQMQGQIPMDWPQGLFDLIVFSEIGYYLDLRDLIATGRAIERSLEPGGHLVAVHWRPRATEYPRDGEAVHRHLRSLTSLQQLAHYEDYYVLLDVLGKGTGSQLSPPDNGI